VIRRPLIFGAILAAFLVGGLIIYDQFLAGDNVPPLTLPSGSSSSPAQTFDSSPTLGGSAGAATADGLVGEWAVGHGTIVGYRVLEKLARLPAQSEAVGRTSSVTGSALLESFGGTVAVTVASFEADLTTLASDDPLRDNRIREVGLEASRFPTATFELVRPIEVPVDALADATVEVTLVGDLTIHGVTKSVSIPVQAQLSREYIEVLGSLTFPFSDFGMTPPNIGGLVSVEDDATMEFVVVLSKR